jgi:hypothetical protein
VNEVASSRKMSAATEPKVAPEIDTIPTHGAAISQNESKGAAEKQAPDVETGSVDEESPKGYYSKLSVWLMILFSGLALGSDG